MGWVWISVPVLLSDGSSCGYEDEEETHAVYPVASWVSIEVSASCPEELGQSGQGMDLIRKTYRS